MTPAPKKPRQYQMGYCRKHRRSYRLPLSADKDHPALAQCDECFEAGRKRMSDELNRLMAEEPKPWTVEKN